MNPYVRKLFDIARKETRLVVGLMSGTSLDGLDVALCEITGTGQATKLKLLHFETVAYEEGIRNEIRRIFAKREIDFQQFCLLNPSLALRHADMVLSCLNAWGVRPEAVDLIASHGQTVFHAPARQHQETGYSNATLQIGDGDHLAVKTGIITISDFRQKHIAAGGEGAPLAVYGDYILFSSPDENRILLNIGGIANFTLLPGTSGVSGVLTSDTGPGNVLMDAFARHFFEQPYDEDGQIAMKGRVHPELLAHLKKNPFFDAPLPKTTGPELFNPDYLRQAQLRSGATSVMPDDLMATLTRFTAESIAETIGKAVTQGETYSIYVSGGGANNPFLLKQLRELVAWPVYPFQLLGYSGDAKEAILFALLANETVAGETIEFGESKQVPAVSLGKISFPG